MQAVSKILTTRSAVPALAETLVVHLLPDLVHGLGRVDLVAVRVHTFGKPSGGSARRACRKLQRTGPVGDASAEDAARTYSEGLLVWHELL